MRCFFLRIMVTGIPHQSKRYIVTDMRRFFVVCRRKRLGNKEDVYLRYTTTTLTTYFPRQYAGRTSASVVEIVVCDVSFSVLWVTDIPHQSQRYIDTDMQCFFVVCRPNVGLVGQTWPNVGLGG